MSAMKQKKNAQEYVLEEQEEYMNDAQREHFTGILETWKANIYEESERTRAHLKDERTQTADLNDRASLEEEFSLELRTRDRERKLLHKIDKALDRLVRDEFGWCEKCGEEIGIRRLEARPTAELCIDCKEIAERKEKSFHDAR
ncbi:RNA polymerase-binding protein DksA [Suttonella sp. R2A3]|uniref:RNA polymerase-binding protein DksA n=1 Tax=Suttonella sp. R2A3 TaxID=2908648 RepID=UPI001F3A2DCD|nr:RNA polymerase-binding protein DksA [Suttonella sp. R2A3]UJF25262.1 RNA polymerase-binding protein DksA [Suttonella sp. R2A3]